MKKFYLLAAVGFLTVSLSACGNSGASEDPEVAETTENTEGVVEEAEATEAVTENVSEVEAGDKEFTITATNFDLVSDEELIVKKGDNVVIHVENAEGVHGIGIKEFGVSGGVGESIEFVATEAGTFEIICSIPCGAGHNDMVITLTVVE